jgi:hypothetical protein
VLVAAYFPRELVPGNWEKLVGYVFKKSAAASVVSDVEKQFGEYPRQFNQAVVIPGRHPVLPGAPITVTPHLEGFQFNPLSITAGFYEDWQSFSFNLRATNEISLNQFALGKLTFAVFDITLAEIPIAIQVVGETTQLSHKPFSQTRPCNTVFCSYSRKDEQIVKRVEAIISALGIEYLRDVTTIRSGEVWTEALREYIDKADMFQLFWSEAAAMSEHVRMEWSYAYNLRRPNFIRPVYWTNPLPPIPTELQNIQFVYRPELSTP